MWFSPLFLSVCRIPSGMSVVTTSLSSFASIMYDNIIHVANTVEYYVSYLYIHCCHFLSLAQPEPLMFPSQLYFKNMRYCSGFLFCSSVSLYGCLGLITLRSYNFCSSFMMYSTNLWPDKFDSLLHSILIKCDVIDGLHVLLRLMKYLYGIDGICVLLQGAHGVEVTKWIYM